MSKSYKDLQIYQISFELFIKVHSFSLKMPKYETYELGSQIRRSAESINSNIVEGYGRRRYKQDYLKFLVYSHASNCETIAHLEKIRLLYTELTDEADQLILKYSQLGGKLNKYIQ